MTNPISINAPRLSASTIAMQSSGTGFQPVCPGRAGCLSHYLNVWGIRLWLAVLIAFCAGSATVRATTSAVITFTNYPAVVSNTYNGVITLQINGLTNGVTNVVVQKFLDTDTNGVIDSGDLLVQQFQLTVGQATVFTNGSTPVTVTNFMPGDMSSATNQIIAPLNFQNGDFAQSLVGQYLFKISSPSGQFTPRTNLFIVTNTFFSSLITGSVENASSLANVTNAMVLLCAAQNGVIDTQAGLNVQAGAVANDSGNFSIRAPPGTYILAAAKSNFVFDASSASEFSLLANQTNDGATVPLSPETTNIAGKFVDSATGVGLPGLAGTAVSTNNLLSLYFTDTNGNFRVPVISNSWVVPLNPFAAAFEGYLTPQANLLLNVSNKLVSITNGLPRATAIFYGTISNNTASPVPGVCLYASDSSGYQSYGMSDEYGNYVAGLLAGTNQWQFSIVPTASPGLGFTNDYVFSPGYIQTNSIATNQAIQQNFVLAAAPFTIQGTVEDVDGNPIAGVIVYATSGNYQAFTATTAADGSYSLNVSPGMTWTVGLSTNSLESLGYDNVPATQSVTISDASVTGINFQVLVCGEIEILTTNLPNATVGSYYDTTIQADSCQNISNWSTAYGITLTSLYGQTNVSYPAGTPIYSGPGLVGYLLTYFSFGIEKIDDNDYTYTTNCTATITQTGPSTVDFSDISATVTVSGPIATNTVVTIIGTGGNKESWTAFSTTQNGSTYTTTLTNGGSIQFDAGDSPLNYAAASNTLMTARGGTNVAASLVGSLRALPLGNSLSLGSSIPYTGSNDAVAWIKNGTTWNEYSISADGPQETNLPPGLTLGPSGSDTAELSGTPTSAGTNGLFNFTVCAVDADSNAAVQSLSLFVYPTTTIGAATSSASSLLLSSNVFQMQINGVLAGWNYTLLMNTNLATTNWVPIFTTNTVNTNSFTIPDSDATNSARFYRLLISP